jgi:hypothetical protein
VESRHEPPQPSERKDRQGWLPGPEDLVGLPRARRSERRGRGKGNKSKRET